MIDNNDKKNLRPFSPFEILCKSSQEKNWRFATSMNMLNLTTNHSIKVGF